MKREFNRTDRIADQLQRELAVLINQELKDPRLGMVTVTAVDVTRELEHAKVFVTVMGTAEPDIGSNLAVLNKAAGFLRRELGRRLRLRTVPALHFQYDESIVRGVRLSNLIDQAVAEDKARHHDD
ncbi:MAG: ribosome-binding factor A [Gammaproteobacteria bacterium RBG_16_57_12]|nr:MAG: ribosome-binding factor A [Gammaproteobacteria bacterium RBG_16_57_12]